MKTIFRILVVLTVTCCLYNCTSNLKLEVPVTFDANVKTANNCEKDSISNFEVDLVKKIADGKYLVTYRVSGSIFSQPTSYKTLEKVLIEEEVDRTSGYDKFVEIIPISQVVGKSPNGTDEYKFNFKNEYELRVPPTLEVAQVKFTCGSKAQILILPREEN